MGVWEGHSGVQDGVGLKGSAVKEAKGLNVRDRRVSKETNNHRLAGVEKSNRPNYAVNDLL